MLTNEFIKAGNATFTLKVSKEFQSTNNTKPHYTWKVKFKKGENGYSDNFFVYVLSGPDNTSDFTYMGLLKDGQVQLTKKSTYTSRMWPVRLLNRVLDRLSKNEGDKITEAGFQLYHEGKCGRCGRKLTTPESIETGIGPECLKQM